MAIKRRGAEAGGVAMRIFLYPLVAGCFGTFAAYAAEAPATSLVFTTEEVQTIEALAAKAAHPVGDGGDVHLGAVFIMGLGIGLCGFREHAGRLPRNMPIFAWSM